MKPNSNNSTGFNKTDISSNQNNQALQNSYHSLNKGNVKSMNGYSQPCASNSSWINDNQSSRIHDKLSNYADIDEFTDFKKLCIFNLPESDGYESSTYQEKREVLLAKEFGIQKEVRKRDEQADSDTGRECYSADKKQKKKKKKVQKTSSIRRSSSKPPDENADLPDRKEERESSTAESVEETSTNQMEEAVVENGYHSESAVPVNEENGGIEGENESDSSTSTNQTMDGMIEVKKKNRNRYRIKNSVVANDAVRLSQNVNDNKFSKSDKTKNRNTKNTNFAHMKPLKVTTTSFDMDQDFPPLCSHPLSASVRREKPENSAKSGEKSQVHPSKSDSDLPAPTKKELQASYMEENQFVEHESSCAEKVEVINIIEVAAESPEVPSHFDEGKDSIETLEETNDEILIESNKEITVNQEELANIRIRTDDLPVEAESVIEPDVPEIVSCTKNVDGNKQQGVPGWSESFTSEQCSDQPGSSSSKPKEVRNDSHRSHSHSNVAQQSSTKFRPRANNPNAGPRRPRLPGFQYPYGNANYGYMNPTMNMPYPPSSGPVAGMPLYYPPASNPSYHGFVQLPPVFGHMPTGFVPHQTYLPLQYSYGNPTGGEQFQNPPCMYPIYPVSAVDSTTARMADVNASPLSHSPEGSQIHTTTESTSSQQTHSSDLNSLVKPIDTIALSPELQKTVREAFGLHPSEGIFYIYATNEKGEHTRQMRVMLHNTTPLKFGKFESPVYLSPTIGASGEYSPAGYYYATQEKVIIPSHEGFPPVTQKVMHHHPIYSFSATIPEAYQVPYMPAYFPDVVPIPTGHHSSNEMQTAPRFSNEDPTPPSTPVSEQKEKSEIFPSKINSVPNPSLPDTSAH